jgi:hypothetical protein
MPPRPAAFAIPGDINRKTGGYIYEKSLLEALRAQGRAVEHVVLPGSFPDAPPADMAATVTRLAGLPADVPLILDGLVYGAIDTAGLAQVSAPLVAMIHHPLGLETGLPPERARDLLRREAQNLALAAQVLVPSAHTRDILVRDFGVAPDLITIAPPGFAPPSGRPDPAFPPLILTVGLIAARKGHDVLVRALARIADLPWQARIVGAAHDPGVARALAAQIAAAGLTGRLAVQGETPPEDLARLYRQATVFALATRYEGYGMVFGEALSHGLPIVACAGGAVPQTVPQYAGLLVPVDDDQGFAAALRSLLTDPARRTAMAAAAAAAGARLPRWTDTAAIAGTVLDAL